MDDIEPTEEKRGPGRPRKETADTVQVWVRMIKALQTRDQGKVGKGKRFQTSLTHARRLVDQKVAEWTDPRPDL